MVSARELEFYEEHGYLVREGVFTTSQCQEIIGHLNEGARRVVQSKLDDGTFINDFWPQLSASAHQFDVFFNRFMPSSITAPPAELERYISRVGHGLHLTDERLAAIYRKPIYGEVTRQLLGAPAHIALSTAIYKNPGDSLVAFHFHQAAAYMHTRDHDVMFIFTALEDADAENGCLQVIPGSHRGEVHVQYDLPKGKAYVERRLLPGGPDLTRAIDVPVRAGSAIFVHGKCYHGSQHNRSQRSRKALLTHLVSANAEWGDTNWFGPPPGGFVPL